MQALSLLHCDAGDAVCQELYKSKFLLRLRSGTCVFKVERCGITEEGVKHIAKIKQLEELVLGKSSDYLDEPAAKTPWASRIVLEGMKNLKELEMRQPDIEEFNLGKQ